jgi:iron complex transport system permease protein
VLALGLVASWCALSFAGLCFGPAGRVGPLDALCGLGEALGWLDPFEWFAPLEDASVQAALELRLWRVLVAGGVGASLALAGAYLQGLFRNALASPSIVGVTAGAVLGASLALALLGGVVPSISLSGGNALAPVWVTGAGFVGAIAVALVVVALATRDGSLSVPTLLLAGVALNALIAGALAALQSLTLRDYEVSRAILSWTFGTLDDRSAWQAGLVWSALALAALAIPFTAWELDLLAGGEDDAGALGVDVRRVKALGLVAACLATAAAVAVAGQIAFVGLVVPHGVRLLCGASHRRVLPLSALAGAVFLLGCDVAQRALLGEARLRPGVLMSLVGGPFFLVLLVRERRALLSW